MIKLILFSASLLIFSCNDDSPNTPEENSNFTESDFEGTWHLYQVCVLDTAQCEYGEYDECDTEDGIEFSLNFTFIDNTVTGCSSEGNDCETYSSFELGSGDSITLCDADLAHCSDKDMDSCNTYGDPCYWDGGDCIYWVDYDSSGGNIFSDTFITECESGTIELSENTLIITTISEEDGCSETMTRYFEKIVESSGDL